MTDYAETIYNDLVALYASGGWNQATYPATIRYYDPNLAEKQFSNLILLEIEKGVSQITQFRSLQQIKTIIHVFLEIQNGQNTTLQNRQYLQDIIDQFEIWYRLKNYSNFSIVEMIPDGDKSKFRVDIWLQSIELS